MTSAAADVVVRLPTPYGQFAAHAFERPSGHVYVALVRGDVAGAADVLVRVHSECLTGDALGSLRCDCGVQLRESMRAIAAAGCGVLVYATGQEGRGIGLMNKLRAYFAQDRGADTVDANHILGLPVDARDYGDAAAVVRLLGVRSVRLLTNNPAKVAGLRRHGVDVTEVVGLRTVAHRRNAGYLSTKATRMGHDQPGGQPVPPPDPPAAVDPRALLGRIRPQAHRPGVVVKLAQSLDGRIATASGDSKWISSEPERALAHALRAACDALIVGVGTVVQDDPLLTVRAVPGASPVRVVVDSRLRLPPGAQLLHDDGATIVVTTAASPPARRAELRQAGVGVEVVDARDGRVDLPCALARLRAMGMDVVLVEGGSELVTALVRAGLVDRMIVSVAPLLLGSGIAAIGDLGLQTVTEATVLTERTVVNVGDDVVIAGDVS